MLLIGCGSYLSFEQRQQVCVTHSSLLSGAEGLRSMGACHRGNHKEVTMDGASGQSGARLPDEVRQTLRELADTDATGGSCAGAGRDGLAFYACLWPWNVVVAPEDPTQVQEGRRT